MVGEIAVICQNKKAFAGIIQAANGIDAFLEALEEFHYRFAAFGIKDRGDYVLRFVEGVIDEVFGSFENLAIDFDLVGFEVGLRSQFRNSFTIDGNAAGNDEIFGFTTAGDASVGENFLKAFFRHQFVGFRGWGIRFPQARVRAVRAWEVRIHPAPYVRVLRIP